jgi:hypothetical protein
MTLADLQELAYNTYSNISDIVDDILYTPIQIEPESKQQLLRLQDCLQQLRSVTDEEEWILAYDIFMRTMNDVWDEVHGLAVFPIISYHLVRFILNVHTHQ